MLRAATLVFFAVLVAGCGSSSGPKQITVGAARTFDLVDFAPTRFVPGKPTRLTFVIRQPSGEPLKSYRTGSGPHTGVHLIVVRSDLAWMIHKHPPIGPGGRVEVEVSLPTPGRYRLVVDAYPALAGPLRNFQLFRALTAVGTARPKPIPPFRPTADLGEFRVAISNLPRLRAIRPAFLDVSVTRSDGKPATFTPWFGALAHAIFFRAGALDYFHTHVCPPGLAGCTSTLGPTQVTGTTTTPGRLRVGVLLPVPGSWRLFLQTKADGRVLTAPFTLRVR